MFQTDVSSTFSDSWYRVAHTHPRLNPHAQMIRQRAGRSIWYIVEDPASGQYYRMSESAYFFAGQLDGKTTITDAWNTCNATLGDDAPTQKECIDLLSQLQSFGLLMGDLPLAADMVMLRHTKARQTKTKQRTGGWFFFSIPVFNPEPLLVRFESIIKLMFSRWGLAAWLVVVVTGLWMLLNNLGTAATQLGKVLVFDPTTMAWLGVVFIGLRIWHELGHAMACKAMGGRSTEIGVILIAGLLPLPYCDATSSWRMPEAAKRIMVSSAGMLVETFAAGIAAIIWAITEPGTLNSVSYQIIIVSGVTTIVFNINPLLRYDGYYILSDLVGSPNLAQRSRELTVYLLERFVYGVPGLRPPVVRDKAEAWFLMVYSLLSLPYRVFITLTILMVIISKFPAVGLLLGAAGAVAWLVWPIAKGITYLLTSPRLVGRRGRALVVVSGTSILLVGLIGLVPMPTAGYASGTVEPAKTAPLRASEMGFVKNILVHAGEQVSPSQAIIELENPALKSSHDQLVAQLEAARIDRDIAMTTSPAQRAVAQNRVDLLTEDLHNMKERLRRLTITSPIAGTLSVDRGIGLDIDNLTGRFIEKGMLIGQVISIDDLVVRTIVPGRVHGYVFGEPGVMPRASVRVHGNAGRVIRASVSRVAPAGTHDLDQMSLSRDAGGDVILDPSDRSGSRTLNEHFIIEVQPENIDGLSQGLRARVRLAIKPTPLAKQWRRRIAQYLSSRLGW